MTVERNSGWTPSWALLIYAALHAAIGLTCLGWLFWRYVPIHTAVFEGFGLSPLPSSTAWVIAASNWFVRLLPFVALLSVVASVPGAILLAVAVLKGAARIAYTAVVAALLLLGTAEGIASAFVVRSIHRGYEMMAIDPHYHQSLRDFDEYRRARRQLSTPQP